MIETLPHLLRPGLRVVFIGYNPAIFSAEAGHYYARPGNMFWRHLSASGIAGREVGPEDDRRLPDEAGIGFTDLCCRPTVRASELTASEIREGAARLHAELLEHQPRIACFSGRGIYQHFGRHILGLRTADLAGRPYGAQPERIGATIPWVIPSSSGLASKWHGERLEWLHALARQIA
jgi:TDG/mug DNA glycosylase family protein